ncbi:hypothetical protein [Rathayibacter toxicus]|uniref:Uncharacterized protein n=1 Tax=Rathayibacter toxicus TaxID=145458 RepID=A0A2S5Y807_9MICO|nr:hypothetical protein [Rathayibacter toxicus]PPH24454.1 hypothetical protein C5D17_04040 [Rathayibacter toxicus]PPH57951.1 hypothetical protein C5D30_04070 [Rathayibacter toxicus]PPH60429.1 hypothetical protein C5C93_04090 [Rathayibacter toxicus]PPH88119.1 hypothetical protein C5D31_04055 [Rathayibacter toxicus]PPI15778.1 hypothetical protein C5C51_04045 [Rathayibacter toxicus]
MTLLAAAAITGLLAPALVTNSVAWGQSAVPTISAQAPAAVREFTQFQIDHPDDLAGQDAEAMRLFGSHVQVRFEGRKDFVDGLVAQREKDTAIEKAKVVPMDSLNNDVFTVWVIKVNTIYGWEFGGHWDFADFFAGQTDPDDVATMEFNIDKCAKLQNLEITTYDVDGNRTNLGSLRDANLGANAPIWNIEDKVSGFRNLADSGAALVWLNADACPLNHYEGQAAFVYHAVENGSVGNVSASWGNFSVSTSGSNLELQKSSQPFDFIY